MNKPIVNMTNWELYVYKEKYNLSGIADAHPQLGKNAYVAHTSACESCSIEKDVLEYETQNTIYRCPLKHMSPYPYGNVVPEYKEKLTHMADGSDDPRDALIAAAAKLSLENDRDNGQGDGFFYKHSSVDLYRIDFSEDPFLEKIKKLQKTGQKEIEKKRKEEERELIACAKQYEDCIYLAVSKVGEGDELAYHIGDCSGVVSPSLHSGMFQDSVLYMKYGKEEDSFALDFRYFPKGMGDSMETYSWSDNIAHAVIKNDCKYTITFNREMIKPGETKIFTPDTHRQGLISPDCHNGKTLFDANERREDA